MATRTSTRKRDADEVLSVTRELWELECGTRGVRELVELVATGGVSGVGEEKHVAFAAVALLRFHEERLRLVAMVARGEVNVSVALAEHNRVYEDDEDAGDAVLRIRPAATTRRRA